MEKKINWLNAGYLCLEPILTAVGLTLYISYFGFAWTDLGIFFMMLLLNSFSVTAGYHRLFSHRAYKASPIVKFFYLFFGAGALQNSALAWCSDHRNHHQYVDTSRDPYNIREGFWWAHIFWIFYDTPTGRDFSNVKDLQKDPLVRWQDKYYWVLSVLVGFGLPTLLGFIWDRPLAGLLWGGFLRLTVTHHSTFLVNSAAHWFGTRPYLTKVSARDCVWLAPFTFGEGYHNFHHAFGADYRNGVKWYDFDPSKWMIRLQSYFGLAYDLQRTPDRIILKARIQAMHENALLKAKADETQSSFSQKLDHLKERLDLHLSSWSEAKTNYIKWRTHLRDSLPKIQWRDHSLKLKQEIALQRKLFHEAWREYKQTIRMVQQPAFASTSMR